MEWQELDPKEIESMDEFIENYKGWKIYFCIPNGGILAVSVSNGKIAYSVSRTHEVHLGGQEPSRSETTKLQGDRRTSR